MQHVSHTVTLLIGIEFREYVQLGFVNAVAVQLNALHIVTEEIAVLHHTASGTNITQMWWI